MHRIFVCFLLALVWASSVSGARADATSDCQVALESDDIIKACTKVIKKEPEARWAYLRRADAFKWAGLGIDGNHAFYRKAIADLTKAIDLDSSEDAPFVERAGLLHLVKNDFEALLDLAMGLSINSKNVMAYSLRATIRRDQDDFALEVADLTKVVELSDLKLQECLDLQGAYQRWGKSIWDLDPKTAAYCNIDKPVSISSGANPAVPAAAAVAEIEPLKPIPDLPLVPMARHVWDCTILLGSLFAVGALIGLAVGALRSGQAGALRSALEYGVALAAAEVFLSFGYVFRMSFNAFDHLKYTYLNDPVDKLLSSLGVSNTYAAVIDWGPLAGYASNNLVALILTAGFMLGSIRFVSLQSLALTGTASAFAAENPHRALAMTFPVMLATGSAVIAAALTYGPRDYMGRLDLLGWAGLVPGVMILAGVPVSVWRRSAPAHHFIIVTAVLILAAYACRNMQDYRYPPFLSFALLFAAFLIFSDWRRIMRVTSGGIPRAAAFAFAWPFAAPGVMAAKASRMDNETLLAAFQLPDHTNRAKVVIEAEMVKRGLPVLADAGWIPPKEQATLRPAFRHDVAPERYRRFMRNRRRMQSVVRWISIIALCTVVGILALATFVPFISLIAGILGRKRAARVLLLRPFGQPQMTAALKKVVRKHLGRLGHTYTLSDRNYRPNYVLDALNRLFDWLMYAVGPLLRPSLRIARVKNERAFFVLNDFLLRTARPSWLGLLCGDQAFNIRTTDAWWKRCIDVLIWSSDIIVMDVSRVSAGSAWEVEQLAKRGLLARCIFIAQADHHDAALSRLEQILGFTSARPDIYVFDEQGNFAKAADLDAILEQRVLDAAAHWGQYRRTEPVVLGPAVRA